MIYLPEIVYTLNIKVAAIQTLSLRRLELCSAVGTLSKGTFITATNIIVKISVKYKQLLERIAKLFF